MRNALSKQNGGEVNSRTKKQMTQTLVLFPAEREQLRPYRFHIQLDFGMYTLAFGQELDITMHVRQHRTRATYEESEH